MTKRQIALLGSIGLLWLSIDNPRQNSGIASTGLIDVGFQKIMETSLQSGFLLQGGQGHPPKRLFPLPKRHFPLKIFESYCFKNNGLLSFAPIKFVLAESQAMTLLSISITIYNGQPFLNLLGKVYGFGILLLAL